MFGFHRKLAITHLASGGLITNYYCTSQCGHCLYGCGPRWEKEYIDEEAAEKNLVAMKSLGCRRIHVGGGEPFLNLDGLKMVCGMAKRLGVNIDYVETNASWYRDETTVLDILSSLQKLGVSTLLVSISPFHNAYIPFKKVKDLLSACDKAGMRVLPWIWDFYREIDAFDDRQTHRMSEYQKIYGEDYLAQRTKI